MAAVCRERRSEEAAHTGAHALEHKVRMLWGRLVAAVKAGGAAGTAAGCATRGHAGRLGGREPWGGGGGAAAAAGHVSPVQAIGAHPPWVGLAAGMTFAQQVLLVVADHVAVDVSFVWTAGGALLAPDQRATPFAAACRGPRALQLMLPWRRGVTTHRVVS